MKVAEYAKAVTAGVVACGGGVGTALADGHVTGQEWIGIAVATVVAVAAVFRVPNADAEPQLLNVGESYDHP